MRAGAGSSAAPDADVEGFVLGGRYPHQGFWTRAREGDREAVRRALAVLGVTDELQVEAISFGEERPRNFGQSETAYAENRRVDIVYK